MPQLKHYSGSDIGHLERFFRANLVNSITGYKPVNLIGTYSPNNVANLALFTSAIHLGANPPLIGLIQRPVGEFSHTYKNIIRDQYYTINHVHEDFIAKAHYTSAKFAESTSEFAACELTEERILDFPAPFVKESGIKIAMKRVREIPIEENNTILLIGEILHLFIREDAILADGNVDLGVAKDVCTTGLYTYNKVTKLQTFPYAKADGLPKWK